MNIRLAATPDHLPLAVEKIVAELDRRCFPTDAAVEIDDDCYWWLVWDKDKPVAFAGMRPCKETVNVGLVALTRCGVVREYRGQGLQKRLLRARVAMARRLGFKQVVGYVKGFNLPSANSLIGTGFKLYRSSWGGKGALHFYRDV